MVGARVPMSPSCVARSTVTRVGSFMVVASLALAPFRAVAATDNHWNQWDDDGLDGVVEGTTMLGLGANYALSGSSEHTVRLVFEGEHLLRDRWGVVGSVGLPVDGAWIAPAELGLRFHLFPKFPIDPFVGIDGGIAWLRPPGLEDMAAPMVDLRAGAAAHYFGIFYAQVDGGYDLVRYGRGGVSIDRSGASFGGRLGVNF